MKNVKWWNLQLQIEELSSIQAAFNNKSLSYGSIGIELEKRLSHHLNVNHTLLTTSGSTSLLVALKTIGIGPGDEVIIPDRTFQATANAVDFLGAKVKLADVDPVTGLITSTSIEKLLTKNSKAVIAVHLNGRAVDLDPIISLKKHFPFFLVEDTAQGFNCKYKGKFLGTIGDIGCFSTGVTKFIATGQGGFLATNSSAHYQIMKNYLFHGMTGWDDKLFNFSGFNFRQSDLLSSLATSQLDKIKEKTNSFINIYETYNEGLNKLSCVKIIPSKISEGEIPIWIEVLSPVRDRLFEFLKKREIETVKFYPSIHRSAHLKILDQNAHPNSVFFEQRGLILPCGPQISIDSINIVIDALREFECTIKND